MALDTAGWMTLYAVNVTVVTAPAAGVPRGLLQANRFNRCLLRISSKWIDEVSSF
jgi:hypothetical protein